MVTTVYSACLIRDIVAKGGYPGLTWQLKEVDHPYPNLVLFICGRCVLFAKLCFSGHFYFCAYPTCRAILICVVFHYNSLFPVWLSPS